MTVFAGLKKVSTRGPLKSTWWALLAVVYSRRGATKTTGTSFKVVGATIGGASTAAPMASGGLARTLPWGWGCSSRMHWEMSVRPRLWAEIDGMHTFDPGCGSGA